MSVSQSSHNYIYIYAFSRRFYPKQLIVHSGCRKFKFGITGIHYSRNNTTVENSYLKFVQLFWSDKCSLGVQQVCCATHFLFLYLIEENIFCCKDDTMFLWSSELFFSYPKLEYFWEVFGMEKDIQLTTAINTSKNQYLPSHTHMQTPHHIPPAAPQEKWGPPTEQRRVEYETELGQSKRVTKWLKLRDAHL